LQGRNRRLVIERQEGEKRLRQEKSELQKQLDGMQLKLWQFDEESPKTNTYWKLMIPCAGEQVDLQSVPEEQRDASNLAEEAAKILELLPKEDNEEEDLKAFLESKTAASPEVQKTIEHSPLESEVQSEVQSQPKVPVKPTSKPPSREVSKSAAPATAPETVESSTPAPHSPIRPEPAALSKRHSPKSQSPTRSEKSETMEVPRHSPKQSKESGFAKSGSRVSSVKARMAMWEKGGGANGSGDGSAPVLPPAFATSANKKSIRPSSQSGWRNKQDR